MSSNQPSTNTLSSSSGPNATRISAPLGMSGTSGTTSSAGTSRGSSTPAATTLPRMLYPVDLGSTSLPGPVISCIWVNADGIYLHNNANLSLPPLFLILVDDPRGSSAAQPGAYAAYWVSLQHGAFHVLNNSNRIPALALPRLSAAVAAYGRVYATAGRSVFTLRVPTSALAPLTEPSDRRNSNLNRNKLKNLPQLQFGPRVWPGPVRCGSDALAVVADGRVVVGCVGHAFYAVAGEEIHRDEDDDEDVDEMADEHFNARAIFAGSNTGGGDGDASKTDCVKLVHWTQSSQVHPAVVLDLKDVSLEADWSCVFLANGRECACVDLYYGPPSQPRLSGSNKPRNGIVTTASPILAASASWPFVAILMSDGLISVRSPSCLAVSLRTVEIGTRPNDFFTLRTVQASTAPGSSNINAIHSVWNDQPNQSSSSTISSSWTLPWIVGISYAGEAKVLQCRPDTAQDLADRLIRHAIDAFGGNGFPRTDVAKAVQASFTATSYVGPEATAQARVLLKAYLEAVLGLCDWESGASSGWPSHESYAMVSSSANTLAAAGGEGGGFQGKWSAEDGSTNTEKGGTRMFSSVLTAAQSSALLTSTALLCLVASQLSPPAAALASRAAKACASEMGVVLASQVDESAVLVGQQVTDQLLREASQAFSLVRTYASTPKAPAIPRIHRPLQVSTDYIEASIWLLRSCGQHESAMEVATERLQQNPSSDAGPGGRGGQWSRIKYESYMATHLSELWYCGQEDARELVLRSPATHSLLESNPRLGLSVFTSQHPQNETQWRSTSPRDDPFRSTDYVYRVVNLLKSIRPKVPYDSNNPVHSETYGKNHSSLPLESGRALAITFLESATGISTGRPDDIEPEENSMVFHHPPSSQEDSPEAAVANFHDELALLLLEGIISERSDDVAPSGEEETEAGRICRAKLRHLLRWPLSRVRPDRILESLPPSFLPEKALILGRLGKHEEALRILYNDLKSLDLALEYCDDRHQRQQAALEKRQRSNQVVGPGSLGDDGKTEDDPTASLEDNNAYLPLMRVALESEDTEKGCAAAIQLLALRRASIDRAAALQLLPPDTPVSAVARPFLIPALVDSESQVRRLTVTSALLRARYLRLKEQLTSAQLKAQANLHVVPQIQSLNLGDPLHSTKPFRARTSGGSSGGSNNMPEVWIVKHFFPRHLVIQARVTNQAGLSEKNGRTLTDIAFVVAESSEEAIQPLLQVPIAVLPSSMTGSTWCVLSAAPGRMEGSTAQLTCELRYTTVGHGDVMALTNQSSFPDTMGKTHVEELQDLEVHASHF